MVLTEERILELANSIFAEDVMEKMRSAGFCAQDVKHITRDDIDQEFKKFKFGIRKSLWLFFKALKAENDMTSNACITDSSLPETNQTSNESLSNFLTGMPKVIRVSCNPVPIPSLTEFIENPLVEMKPIIGAVDESNLSGLCQPAGELNKSVKSPRSIQRRENEITRNVEDAGETSMPDLHGSLSAECTSTAHDTNFTTLSPSLNNSETTLPKIRPKRMTKEYATTEFFEKFRNRPPRMMNSTIYPYPGGIPYPFPLSNRLKNVLRGSRMSFAQNRTGFLHIVREVAEVVQETLGRSPDRDKLMKVAKNLCKEYPVLQCEGKNNYCYFYATIRKRIINTRYKNSP